MSDEKQLQPGLVIAARYRVVKRVGTGGMGSVYLVVHVHTEEKLALKVLHKAVIDDSNTLERFRREARTPARIDSEYVVRVTDADAAPELGGAPFLVMEYLRGTDIDQRIEATGPFSSGATVALLRQASRALDKAHSLGIVHRDLKPENLFVVDREDGTQVVKVLDFGIAKFTANPEDVKISQATQPGAVFGTPLFMSPEQAIDSSKVSSKTDIWALGLIAYRMLTGRDYWTAETLTQLIAQIAYEPMVAPSERGATLGPEFDAWFLKCCARPLEQRYETAGEAVGALAAALGLSDAMLEPSIRIPLPISMSPVTAKSDVNVLSDTHLASTRSSPASSNTGKLGLAALVLVGVGVGAFVLFGGQGDGPNQGQGALTAESETSVAPTSEPAPSAPASASGGAPLVEPLASATPGVVASASAAPSATPAADPPPRPPTGSKPPLVAPPSTGKTPPPPKTAAPASSDPFDSRF